ncbi:MAG: hypothetical protein J0M12_07590 [Deltaproteobacteria bacterium]|nr:hypothetical protein [Deltaproteobacteria bacterium]
MSLPLPARIRVAETISSRYAGNERPSSWDLRKPGVDVIRTADGHTLTLHSDGGQSPPKKGWELMLTDSRDDGYAWTLYALPR